MGVGTLEPEGSAKGAEERSFKNVHPSHPSHSSVLPSEGFEGPIADQREVL